MIATLAAMLVALSPVRDENQEPSRYFREALTRGAELCEAGRPDEAHEWIERALERDPRSQEAWALRARWAEAIGDRDEQIYSLHYQYRLAVAQGMDRKSLEPLAARLQELDPMAEVLFDLRHVFVERLTPIAEEYEKEGRPHSAIRVHQEILALDPEHDASKAAIERISAAPDPSLAETAKPKDLLADISTDFIEEHDAEHDTWKTRATLTKQNYVTMTDAGYEVLIRSAEAMEQMSAFYRRFFEYGTPEDGRGVSRIEVRIFRDRDEYLKLGRSPPEWSGGQFTGSAVETYIGDGGFQGMVSVLFHEAAHQYVSLATTATGWLNEGLASFFEGTQILANGTVLMNLPNSGRLYNLTRRMEQGWMTDESDGIDQKKPEDSSPEKAPTFSIVLENRYTWGPPWYAPTWGVVYFLYNYRDPFDGRYLYRAAFREFINASGGRVGEGAVENFEEIVLRNPAPRMKGVDYSEAEQEVALPRTVAELNEVWKDWMLRLRDQLNGVVEDRPEYLRWARFAVRRDDFDDAAEYFEKALVEDPFDVDAMTEFAELLAGHFKNTDRAAKLVRQAIHQLEAEDEVDEKRLQDASRQLAKWDPRERDVERIREQILASATGLVQRYLDAELPLMAMDVSSRLGNDLSFPELFPYYEEAIRASGKTLARWQLAYNEQNLDGWVFNGTDVWQPRGEQLDSRFGKMEPDVFDFNFLTFDKVTSGDFSMEVEVRPDPGLVSFCGLVFGQKNDKNFQALILHPGLLEDQRYGKEGRDAYLDLTTFWGDGGFRPLRHTIAGKPKAEWHKLRIDVIGRTVDAWFDGDYVFTHEYPSRDVLRGSFGLMTGPGETLWRNVRYLAREPRDRSAAVERETRLGMLREQAASEGRTLGDSFLDIVPPFPTVKEWVQEPLASWDELGPVPAILVFWSIAQNDSIPVHDWLAYLMEKYQDVGLRVVSVAAPDDAAALPGYLDRVPFPGSVAVDVRRGVGYGESFEAFLIHKYQMPRVLVLDVDHRVVWEGDPGFERGVPWSPAVESFADPPLEDLVQRRQLRSVHGWLEEWNGWGRAALRSGDLERALPLLVQLDAMKGAAVFPEIDQVLRKFGILRSTVLGIESTALALERAGAEPAVPTLIEWSELLGQPVEKNALRELRPYIAGERNQAWNDACKLAARTAKKITPRAPERGLEYAAELLPRLEAMPGELPARLRESLALAVEDQDLDGVRRILDEAGFLPGAWLIQDYLDW